MKDWLDTSWIRRIPAGVLGMLVLVGAVERFVARHDLDFSTTLVANWRNAEANARRSRSGREVLGFGSSMTNHALLPSVIERRIGGRTRNLATFGGTMPATYFLVKHALESGERPETIVLDCSDAAVAGANGRALDDLQKQIRLWPEVLTFADCVELSWTARDADFLASMVVSWALPSARARYELRGSILAAFAGRWTSSMPAIAVARRNWRVNGGANVMAVVAERVFKPVNLPTARRGTRWTSNRLCEIYARRLLRLTTGRNIPVVWVMPPVGPRVKAWRDQTGLADHATGFARRIKAEFPAITLVDGRGSGYPEHAFSDGLHLNRDGAVAFSSELASILADRSSPAVTRTEWVVLPPFRKQRSDAPIEDLEQSRTAVLDAMSRAQVRVRVRR